MSVTHVPIPVHDEADRGLLIPPEIPPAASPTKAARRRARQAVAGTRCAECGSPARELAPGSLTVGLCSPCWQALP